MSGEVVDTVRVDITYGAHLTSTAVLDALERAEQQKKLAVSMANDRAQLLEEKRDDARHWLLIAARP